MSDFPIIGKLGGREAVFALLRKEAPDKIETIDALRMWTAREQIPGWAQTLLMAAAESARLRYTAADFTLPQAAPKKRKRA